MTTMSKETNISINNKNISIEKDSQSYLRLPIKTHIILPNENLIEIIDKYVKDKVNKDDLVFIAESVVAITQGRAYKLSDIKPRKLACFLSTKVTKNPGGVGLTCPEMMEMAFREAGTPRMLLAAFASVIGKLLGKKGWFYIVAGSKVRDIDGPDEYTIPPFNEYVVLAPENPNKIAKEISEYLGCQVAIVDINDLGQNVLGNSVEFIEGTKKGFTNKEIASLLKDNPLGQSCEQTPIGIIRKEN